MKTVDEPRKKKCSHCGKLKPDVLGKQRLCSGCESEMDYCCLCDEWGSHCRHVQYVDDPGCLFGCGSTEVADSDHKESFFVLLRKFRDLPEINGESLLIVLRRHVAENNFWTRWSGPLIGYPPDLELRRKGTYFYNIHAGEQMKWGEAIPDMQIGMAWLTSLDDTTKAANALTVKWIDEFLKEVASA